MSRVLPILFNSDMVRAILDGRKTVTRRVVKFPEGQTGRLPESGARDHIFYPGGIKYAPYQPGDILYVRETWFYEHHMEGVTEGEPDLPSGRYFHRYVYRADDPDYPVNIGIWANGWQPSIHMPKEAARIWLKVTDVRVERLQDITFEGCLNEGAFVYLAADGLFNRDLVEPEAKRKFCGIWNSTIKKFDLDLYGWDANPYVFVIEFERCEKPEGRG